MLKFIIKFKNESRLGKYGPLEIVEKEGQGYSKSKKCNFTEHNGFRIFWWCVFFKGCVIYEKKWFNNGINP